MASTYFITDQINFFLNLTRIYKYVKNRIYPGPAKSGSSHCIATRHSRRELSIIAMSEYKVLRFPTTVEGQTFNAAQPR